MSGFQEDQFPSQFNNSYFNTGPFIESAIALIDTETAPQQKAEKLPLKSRRLKLTSFDSLREGCIPKKGGTIGAEIILKENSDASTQGGKVSDLTTERSFTAADILRVNCAYLGRELMFFIEKKSKDESQLEEVVTWYLQGVFRGDPAAQSAYRNIFLKMVQSYYDQHKPSTVLSDAERFWKVLMEVWDIALREVISKAFQYLADSVRSLKIGEGQEHLWKPVATKNGIKYEPLFISEYTLQLNKFAARLLKIGADIEEKMIKEMISSLEELESRQQADNSYWSLLPEGIFHEITEVIKAIPKPIGLLHTITKNLVYANELVNAFLVGVLNGFIELIASTLELISILTDHVKLRKLLNAIKGLLIALNDPVKRTALLVNLLVTFISKYRNAESAHDIAKYLGEDLAEIIFSILQASTGVGAVKVGAKLAARAGIKAGPKTLNEIPDLLKQWTKELESPEDTRKLLEREGRDSDLKLEPRIFDDLSPDQKRDYLKQQEVLADIDKTGEVPKGTRTNESGETVPRVDRDNTAKGNWGQMWCSQDFMNRAPFRMRPMHKMVTSISSKIVNKRIDCIFENLDYKHPGPPPKYLLVEAKSLGSVQSVTVDGYKQGAFEWNMERLEKTLRDNPEFKDMSKVEMESLLAKIRDSHESLLYRKEGVLNQDKTIVEPEIWLLDAKGNKVKDVTELYLKKY